MVMEEEVEKESALRRFAMYLRGVQCTGHVLLVREHQQDGVLQVLLLCGHTSAQHHGPSECADTTTHNNSATEHGEHEEAMWE